MGKWSLQVQQVEEQLEALQQEHHRLNETHGELEKQNGLLREECTQLQVCKLWICVSIGLEIYQASAAVPLHCYISICLRTDATEWSPLSCQEYLPVSASSMESRL